MDAVVDGQGGWEVDFAHKFWWLAKLGVKQINRIFTYLCPTVPRGPRDNFHHEKIGTQVRTLHADQVRTILCVPRGHLNL